MEKIKKKLTDLVFSCKETFATGKNKAMLGLMTLSYMLCCPGVVFADSEELAELGKQYLTKTVDIVFLVVSLSFIIPGAVFSATNIKKFVEAQGDRDGNATKEASNHLVVGLILVVIGILILSFKTDIMALLNAAMSQ